jgi:hypothetical protein
MGLTAVAGRVVVQPTATFRFFCQGFPLPREPSQFLRQRRATVGTEGDRLNGHSARIK